MPCKSLTDLPESVRDNLPHHAQEIDQAAYNNAWDQYDHDDSRTHRVARCAVERDYAKDDDSGKWHKKDS